MSELKVTKTKLNSVISRSDAALSAGGKLGTSDGLAHVGNGMRGAQSAGTAGGAAKSLDETSEKLRKQLREFVNAVKKTQHMVERTDACEASRFGNLHSFGFGAPEASRFGGNSHGFGRLAD